MKAALFLTAFALTSQCPVLAGPVSPLPAAPPVSEDKGWEFRFAPYLWAQGLDGVMGVRGVAGNVDIPFADIWDDLDFAFMGAFEARRGRWGILTDINYAELSDSIATRDVLLTNAHFKQRQFVGNLTVNYRLLENNTTSVDLYGGARMNWMDLEIGATGPLGAPHSSSGDDFWADAIVGLRLQTALSERCFLRFMGDIGAGGSDFTWQATGLIGWKLTDTCNLGVGYRGLGTDYQNGGFTYDVTASGPVLGVEWKF